VIRFKLKDLPPSEDTLLELQYSLLEHGVRIVKVTDNYMFTKGINDSNAEAVANILQRWVTT
jgi:hypothetical protein